MTYSGYSFNLTCILFFLLLAMLGLNLLRLQLCRASTLPLSPRLFTSTSRRNVKGY